MRFRWLALILALMGGVLAGDAAWWGATLHASSRAPEGWTLSRPEGALAVARTPEGHEVEPGEWDLERGDQLRPTAGERRPMTISLAARLPIGGHLEIWPAAGPDPRQSGGLVLALDRIQGGAATVWTWSGGRRARHPCGEDLPVPGDGWMSVTIDPADDHVRITAEATTVRCEARLPAEGPALVAGSARVGISNLSAGPHRPTPDTPGPRALWWLGGVVLTVLVVWLELWMGGEPKIICWTTAPLLMSVIGMGRDLRAWAEAAHLDWVPTGLLPILLPFGLAAGLKAAHMLARMLHERPLPGASQRDWPAAAPVAAILPVVLALPGAPGALSEDMILLLGMLIASAAGIAAPLLATLLGSALPRRTATWVLAFASLGGCSLALTDPTDRTAIAYASLAAASLGTVVWANANPGHARAFNFISLAGLAAAVGAIEVVLRFTPAGDAWRPMAHLDQANQTFLAMEGHQRAEAGGARTDPLVYVMGAVRSEGDVSDATFVNMLALELRGSAAVQVQPASRWTSFHALENLRVAIDDIDPRVVILYLGNDDLLTPVPMPYAGLYAAWQQSTPEGRARGPLDHVRLVQGLRYLITTLRPSERRVAVPIEDARAYLSRVGDLLQARGGRVVLASEAMAPDPTPLRAYARMQAELAQSHDAISFVDTAWILHMAEGPPTLSGSGTRLSQDGHSAVADALIDELARLGMVPPPSRPDARDAP